MWTRQGVDCESAGFRDLRPIPIKDLMVFSQKCSATFHYIDNVIHKFGRPPDKYYFILKRIPERG